MINLREESLVRALGLTCGVVSDARGFGALAGHRRIWHYARHAEDNISGLMAYGRGWISESEIIADMSLFRRPNCSNRGGDKVAVASSWAYHSILDMRWDLAMEEKNMPLYCLSSLVHDVAGYIETMGERDDFPESKAMESVEYHKERCDMGWWMDARFGGAWEAGAGTPGEVIPNDHDLGSQWICRLANAIVGELWFYCLDRELRAMASVIAMVRELPDARIAAKSGGFGLRPRFLGCSVYPAGGNCVRLSGPSGDERIWEAFSYGAPAAFVQAMHIVREDAEARADGVMFALASLGVTVGDAMERACVEEEVQLVAEIHEAAAAVGAAPWLRAAVSCPADPKWA